MIKYVLDTNICIYLIKKRPESVLKKLSKLSPAQVAVSAVTWSELVYGAEKSLFRDKNLNALRQFILPFEILPWTAAEAEVAGRVRASLEKNGTLVGPFDLMIAAQALALKSTLVTNNEREFARIKELKLENWVN